MSEHVSGHGQISRLYSTSNLELFSYAQVPHSSIVVYGKEYSFADQGIEIIDKIVR